MKNANFTAGSHLPFKCLSLIKYLWYSGTAKGRNENTVTYNMTCSDTWILNKWSGKYEAKFQVQEQQATFDHLKINLLRSEQR